MEKYRYKGNMSLVSKITGNKDHSGWGGGLSKQIILPWVNQPGPIEHYTRENNREFTNVSGKKCMAS